MMLLFSTFFALTVALPENPAPAERFAAEELKAACGGTDGVIVRLESGTDPADGFTITAADGVVSVRGTNPRGTLYGVYGLLERFAGCGWYTPWRTVIPKDAKLVVPDGTRIVERAAFEARQPSWYGVRTNRLFAARCRLNAESPDGLVPHPDPKFGGYSLKFAHRLYSSHTFLTLLPPDLYFKDHPEWFSEVNGRRIRESTQLCLTNPDAVRAAAKRALEFAAADPGCRVVGVSQMDWGNFCTCAKCRAALEEEGAISGLILRFVNAVAEEVEKKRPDLLVETIAYYDSLVLPRKTRPRKNVMVCCCVNAKTEWRPLIDGWSRIAANLMVWDYTPNFRWYNLPHPNVREIASDIRFFRDRGVRWLYIDGAPLPAAAFGDLKCWTFAKLAWDPDQDPDTLVDRFCRGCYGAGGRFARQAYDLENATLAKHPEVRLAYGDEDRPEVFTDDYLRAALGLWSQAERATADEPDALFAVRMAKFSPLMTFLMRHIGEEIPAALLDEEAFIRGEALKRGIDLHSALQRGQEAWLRRRIGTYRETGPAVKKERVLVAMDDCAVRDGDYAGGEWNERRAYHAKRIGEAVEIYPRDELDAVRWFFSGLVCDGTRYRMRVRVKAGERIAAKGPAFSVAVKGPGATFRRTVDASGLGEDWQWVNIGELVPDRRWRFDVRGARSGESAVRSVRVDAIEFSIAHETHEQGGST